MSSEKGFQIGIVGAGIAGLGAAIGLRRAGHDVVVFERSQFKNEVGAAITITPNATRILDHWGFDYKKAGAVENHQIRMQMGDSLKLIWQDTLYKNEKLYGYKCWFFHRVDLHEGLRSLALDPTAAGKPATITLDTEVVEIDSEKGELTLANGDKVQKDIIVVADGAHCRFLREITGQDVSMQKTGRSSFRTLIPFDRIMEDETTRALFENELEGFMAPFVPGDSPFSGVICVTYPCRSGQLLNCAIMHPTREDMEDREDWNSPATVDDRLDCIKGAHPTLQALFKKADVVKVYTLMDHDPLDQMTRGKAVLIGDAAHPMLPTHAQGGGASLEDAAALEVLFQDVTDGQEIPKRLQMVQDVRLARCAVVQIMSNNFARTPEKMEEDVKKYYKIPIPAADSKPFGEAYRDFFWPYDVFEESTKVLRGVGDPRIFGKH